MADLEKAVATQLANIEKRTGKSLEELAAIVKRCGSRAPPRWTPSSSVGSRRRSKPRPDGAILRRMVPVTTPRLRLRELTHDDAPFIRELVNDPAWLRFIGDRNVRSDEDARGYVDAIRDGSYAKHGFGLWVVESAASGEALGLAGLIQRDWLAHVDVGFALLERHRGRGYAREAMAAVLELARTRFGLARVVAFASTDNVASHRVLEDSGFHFERPIREPATGEELSLFARELAP